jgi:hypothetical protein
MLAARCRLLNRLEINGQILGKSSCGKLSHSRWVKDVAILFSERRKVLP